MNLVLVRFFCLFGIFGLGRQIQNLLFLVLMSVYWALSHVRRQRLKCQKKKQIYLVYLSLVPNIHVLCDQ
jgi:hypothetical protein